MKKIYDSPEFDFIKFSLTEDVLNDSRTEGGAGGGDFGSDDNFGSGD